MARRSSNTASTSTPEAPEEAAVTTETKAPEAEVNLTDFQTAAQNAVSEADTATGEIATALVESVVTEYRKLEGLKPKNAAKAWLNEQMKAQMDAKSLPGARSYLQLHDSMSAGNSGSTSTRTPADPTQAFVERAATLRLAIDLVAPGEGVAEDWADKAKALVSESREAAVQYRDWLVSTAEDKGDEPEASAVVKAAVKLSQGRAAKAGGRASGGGGSSTGERRDIGKHIAEAFADKEAGTFMKVAEIAKFKSSEYGDNPPSAGAISARLFPQSGKCTVEGIEPSTNESGNKGATKL